MELRLFICRGSGRFHSPRRAGAAPFLARAWNGGRLGACGWDFRWPLGESRSSPETFSTARARKTLRSPTRLVLSLHKPMAVDCAFVFRRGKTSPAFVRIKSARRTERVVVWRSTMGFLFLN